MKISVICFSMTGAATAAKLKQGLEKQGNEVTLFCKSKYLENSISVSTQQWAGGRFREDDGMIFVGACGIAVRSIAPYVASKKTDPAVLVIDECGKYVISLLSGHLGGANDLALKVADILKGQAVVTTATDLHSCFAVDVFARRNNCGIFFMKAAKDVSAAILAGEKVGFYSEFPWKGRLPEGLTECNMEGRDSTGRVPENGIAVTVHTACMPFKSTVQVVPKILTLGMGCRTDKEFEAVRKAAEECLAKAGIHRQAVEKLASISLKKNERGLIEFAKLLQIPFETYDEETLQKAEGEFTPSAFVKTITGVDNVCERSAVTGAHNGRLLIKKAGSNGVTTALAVREWEVRFE